ncbi:protein TolR [Rivibacter subsaxonicus]|uniref:Cell division and transport-associated protein TolR n=1 Tax=Rivibacter subsaxonicus TaxID=457575 RepID=A0A4Q7VNI3_9BURK|nr:protein TolR [Rivibacter subsaxonicus]RZT97936.1 cell division and transport-associated protein TolR [Rivibacter subsaxonicus]
MASIAPRAGSRRRVINEINMVPFIDVMLVLLIIFMVSAPLITTGTIDLPSVGRAKSTPDKVIEISVAEDGALKLRVDGGDPKPVRLADLASTVSRLQGGSKDAPVVIAADRNVKYDKVMQAMDVLRKAGVQRVGLAVKSTG